MINSLLTHLAPFPR